MPSAAQLVVGNDVKIGGSRVGAVTEIKPKPLDDGRVIAVLDADARQGRRPAAEGLDADRPAALGARPQVRRDHPRASRSESFEDGDTIALAQAKTPVELDEFLNMFDEETRAASQANLEGFGTAFAGRGESINTAIGAFRPLLRDIIPVMRNLSDAARPASSALVVELGDAAAIVAPAAETQASLFRNLDTTMARAARGRAPVHPGLDHERQARAGRRHRELPAPAAVPGQHRGPDARAAARRARAAHGRAGALGRARRRHRGAAEDAAAQPPAGVAAAGGADVRQRPAGPARHPVDTNAAREVAATRRSTTWRRPRPSATT